MTISLLGDGIYLVAVAWQVYDLNNDPLALSLVGTAWTLGMVAVPAHRRAHQRPRRPPPGADRAPTSCAPPRCSRWACSRSRARSRSGISSRSASSHGHRRGVLRARVRRDRARHRLGRAPRRRPTRSQQIVRQAAAASSGPAIGGLIVARARRRARRSSSTPATFAPQRGRRRGSARPLAAGRAGAARRAAELREGARLRAHAAVAVVDADLREPRSAAVLPRPARGAPALRRAQRPRTPGRAASALVLAAAGVGRDRASLVVSQRGMPRRYLTLHVRDRGPSRRCRSSGYAVGTHAVAVRAPRRRLRRAA